MTRPRPRHFVLTLFLLIAVAALSGLAARFVGAQSPGPSENPAQTALLFAVSAQVGESTDEVFRYRVTAGGAGTLETVFTDASFDHPGAGVAFSPAGEMFVTNRGPHPQGPNQGSVTRILNAAGVPAPNGTIASGAFGAPHFAAFRGDELFVANPQQNNVLRFKLNAAGEAVPNGEINAGLGATAPRGVAVAPWGELFVSECCGVDAVFRYTFDADGNASPNGVITGGLSNPHNMAFSPWGELFVANYDNSTVARFTFDAARDASFHGLLGSPNPIDVAFSPWGELFVVSHTVPEVARFTFDAAHNAAAGGSISLPVTCGSIAFFPASAPTPPFQISIDPGAYAGDFYVDSDGSLLPSYRGPRTLTLEPGVHTFNAYYHAGGLTFEVGADGSVRNVSNPTMAHASGNTLVLHNASVTIDPQAFQGSYQLVGQDFVRGLQTVALIPGVTYAYSLYYHGDGFFFDVDAAGQVGNVTKPAVAHAAGSAVVLHNTEVTVNTRDFGGRYRIDGQDYTSGSRTFVLIPGLTFRYNNYYQGDGFAFDVDASGALTNVEKPAAAHSDGAVLVLHNSCLSIDPGSYAGTYSVSTQTAAVGGVSRHVLVPGLVYELITAGGYRSSFAVGADGQPAPPVVVIDVGGHAYGFGLSGGACDQSPPATTARLSAEPNAAGWNNSDVTVTLDASDEAGGSGLREIVYGAAGAQPFAQTSAAGSSVSLTITAEGLTTLTYFARDNAGNAEAARALTVKIDKTAPTITVTRPAAGAAYTLGQQVSSVYACSDGGSGVAACAGPVASGAYIDTAAVGAKTFAVSARDAAGNESAQATSYAVGYAVAVLFDQTKAHKSGSTVPVKLRLTDAAGVNLSSPSLVVHATDIYLISTGAPGALEDAGQSNPDFNFRYDPGGYVFNLKTTGYATGTYALTFTAGVDPTTHAVQLQVRQ